VRVVVQRVSAAAVEVDGAEIARIGRGLLVLVGVAKGDREEEAEYLARKTAALRIFEDGEGKMNLSVRQVGGEVLSVSQFTLLADTRKGNRPGFDNAAPPAEGERLYEHFCAALGGEGVPVRKGVFGAHMHVSLVNDGPVTIILDSKPRTGGAA
jgi:D-tyrosyl-tRNA(Tyr) deacylase